MNWQPVARGVVICDRAGDLAQAIADTIRGERRAQDAYYLRGVGWVCRCHTPVFVEYSVQRRGDRVVIILFLVSARDSVIRHSQQYTYGDQDADDIGRNAASRFWVAVRTFHP